MQDPPIRAEALAVIQVVCRNCDLPMQFEEENPFNYRLYKCAKCSNRVGLDVRRLYVSVVMVDKDGSVKLVDLIKRQ